jgi:choline dehydrogenase-like flavoprotein
VPHPSNQSRLVLDSNDGGVLGGMHVEYDRGAEDRSLGSEVAESIEGVYRALGAELPRIALSPPGTAQHEAGGLRMAAHPRHGVTDRWGRMHSLPNVAVADAATWPSQGAANPCLTITANALRVADAIHSLLGG